MNKKTLIFGVALSVLFIVVIAVIVILHINNSINRPADQSNAKLTAITIEQGESVDAIGSKLEKAGLINGSEYFKIYLWRTGLGSKLKAGNYEFSPNMTIEQIADILINGEAGLKSNEVRVSIPEGLSNDQVLEKLKSAGAIQNNDYFTAAGMDLSGYDFLEGMNEKANLQGFLFPDTYNFFKNSSTQEVMKSMLDNFDKKLTSEMRADIKRKGRNIYDIVILASIIEKEAAGTDEMPYIASVFYNRLRIGKPLQSDATINYITGAGRAMPTNEDLEIDSPYNTYKYAGLPPTPICNPGIDAIKAAIYPAETDYFYFLTTQDEKKTTYFSKTYEEHLQNKATYLK
jgi:UPF0755 protein